MPVDASDVTAELAFGADALGISDSEFTELLDGLISRETERVTDAVDAAFEPETVEEVTQRPEHVDGHDLPLEHRPVRDLIDVSVDTGTEVAVSDVIVHDTHLELDPDADRSRWPTKRRSVTVEYEHGYTTVPEPINGAIIGLVRHALAEIEADGIESEAIENDSVTYEPKDAVVRRHLTRAKRFRAPSYYGSTGAI